MILLVLSIDNIKITQIMFWGNVKEIEIFKSMHMLVIRFIIVPITNVLYVDIDIY